MKAAPRPTDASPRLPKSLPARTLDALENHAEVTGSTLSNCDFTHQAASDLLFEQVILQHVIFLQTRINRIRLVDLHAVHSDFSGAQWEKAGLRRVEILNCRMIGIQLVEARLDQVSFKECNLESAVLASAVFKGARFENCNLRDATFEGADLSGAVFRRCDLSKANLAGAKLNGTDLRGSQLGGMVARPEDMRGALIDSTQVMQLVALLGVTIQEED